mgnify:FL=1
MAGTIVTESKTQTAIRDLGKDKAQTKPLGTGTRPKKAKNSGLKPMDDSDFESIVSEAIQDAERFNEDELMPARIKAMEYHDGLPFGNEEDGKSQVVLTEFRDTVEHIMPDLMRIFTSGEKVVEFTPNSEEDIESAEQATNTVNHIFYERNNGYNILYSAFHDGLTKKLGVITGWVEDEIYVRERTYSAISVLDAAAIADRPGIEVVDVETDESDPEMPLTTITIRQTKRTRNYKIEAVPPEDFLISRDAKDGHSAKLIGRRAELTVSDLVKRGYDYDEIIEYGAPNSGSSIYGEEERERRQSGSRIWQMDNADPSMMTVVYYEVFMAIDKDGDGIAELRKICAIGENSPHVINDEVVSCVNYALFSPFIVPHTAIGGSIGERTMDLQFMKSMTLRAIMNSMESSIFPRTTVVEGQVNINDALNTEVGAIIRQQQPGMVGTLAVPFVGQQAMPLLDAFDQIKAQRTGATPASQGLDADLLQSTTATAVSAQVTASQAHIEMIARNYAGTGMCQLFKFILNMLIDNQNEPMMVRLANKFVPVDPMDWDPWMDVRPNVGLGRGDDSTQITYLTQILAKQEQTYQMLGPDNGVVTIQMIRNTIGDIINKMGHKNVSRYFGEVGPDLEQKLAQRMAQSAPQDPSAALAKAEELKARIDAFAKAQNAANDRVKIQLDADLARDKLYADTILKAKELQMKYGVQIDIANIEAEFNKQRADVESLSNVLVEREKQATAQLLGFLAPSGASQQ